MKTAFLRFFAAPVAKSDLALGTSQVHAGLLGINNGEFELPAQSDTRKIGNSEPIHPGNQLSGDIAVLFPGASANWW